jgi:hypothetical protein
MKAHIRYEPSVAPVLEGMVRAGLIEVLPESNNGFKPDAMDLEFEKRVEKIRAASLVLSQRPGLYEEWIREIEEIRKEWE